MDKELRKSMIRVLEQCKEPVLYLHAHKDANTVQLLHIADYLTNGVGGGHNKSLTSLSGLKYLERLKAPRMTWLKKHWFAASIATITGVAALASVILQAVGLILE